MWNICRRGLGGSIIDSVISCNSLFGIVSKVSVDTPRSMLGPGCVSIVNSAQSPNIMHYYPCLVNISSMGRYISTQCISALVYAVLLNFSTLPYYVWWVHLNSRCVRDRYMSCHARNVPCSPKPGHDKIYYTLHLHSCMFKNPWKSVIC